MGEAQVVDCGCAFGQDDELRRGSVEEEVEGGAEQEGEQDVRDEDAGEEEDAGGGEDGEAGVEGGLALEGFGGPAVAEQREQEDGDGLREMGGEGVEAEDAEADGDDPVGQRSFFEIADAVDAQGDPVAGESHLAGGVGVGGVGVVEQGRGEERGEEDDQPEAERGWRRRWSGGDRSGWRASWRGSAQRLASWRLEGSGWACELVAVQDKLRLQGSADGRSDAAVEWRWTQEVPMYLACVG